MGPPAGRRGSAGEVRTLSFAPDGSTFVIADAAGEVQLWDAHGHADRPSPTRQPGVSASAVFHPDGHTVVIATADGAVFRWDTRVERTIESPAPPPGAT